MQTFKPFLLFFLMAIQAYTWDFQNSCPNQSCRDQWWRYQLMKNLPNLTKKGYPGQIVVFGDNAAVILVGSKEEDVLIGAAELGQGRMLLLGHGGYLKNFTTTNTESQSAQLQKNIKNWLTDFNFDPSKEIITAEEYILRANPSPSQYPIIYTLEPNIVFTQAQKDMIVDYVKNGGGLVAGITTWTWQDTKGSTNYSLMLTYKAFAQAGLTVNDGIIWGSSTLIADNPDAYLSHIGKQFNLTFFCGQANTDYSLAEQMFGQVYAIPSLYRAEFKLKLDSFPVQQLALLTPSSTNKVFTDLQKIKIQWYEYFVFDINLNGVIAPAYQQFPGKVNETNPNYSLTYKEFLFDPTGRQFTDFYQTGYYAVAGQSITIDILGTAPRQAWEVYIGHHTDYIFKRQQWPRWPIITKIATLTSTHNVISSAFGGLIFFKSPKVDASLYDILNVNISNIVQAAYFNSQDTANVNDWNRRKYSSAPWGMVEGKWVGFHFPVNSLNILNQSYLNTVLNLYDQIYQSYHELRGTDPNDYRKQYVTSDIQTSNGHMHAGYPISAHLEVSDPSQSGFFLNYTTLTTVGRWGIFHELGHNMQRDWWTPSWAGEVTVNIFSLKASKLAANLDPLQTDFVYRYLDDGKAYLNNVNFTKMKNSAGIALLPYAQIICDFGFDTFKNVFTSYESQTSHPSSDQDIIDVFWGKVSIQLQLSMKPLLDKWGIPYSSNFLTTVNGLSPYVQQTDMFAGI